MAIAFVQSKENSFTATASTLSVTLTSAATTGNCLIVSTWYASTSTGTPTCVTTGGTGSDSFGTPVYTAQGTSFTNGRIAVFVLKSCGAGRTGATITYSGGTNPAFGDCCIWEVSGLANATLDKVVKGDGNSGTAASGSTGTLSTAAEFAISAIGSDSNASVLTSPWTSDGQTAGTASAYAHQVTAATTALSSSTAITGANNWCSVILTFMTPAAGWTHVQGQMAQNVVATGTTYSLALGAAVGSGNLVTVFFQYGNGTNLVSTVKDNQGNTYFQETTVNDGASGTSSCFASLGNITNAPTTITITFTTTGITAIWMAIDEWSGETALADPRDAHTSGQVTTASLLSTGPAITTTVAGDLIVYATTGTSANCAYTAGSGFSVGTATTDKQLSTFYQTQGSAGAITPTAVASANSVTSCNASVSFKPLGAAAPAVLAAYAPTTRGAGAMKVGAPHRADFARLASALPIGPVVTVVGGGTLPMMGAG